MSQRYIGSRNYRATQHRFSGRGSNKLILEPGIFVKPVTIDLTEFEIIKISALIVIAQDGASTAYLCQRFVCQAPTTDPAELLRQLEAT